MAATFGLLLCDYALGGRTTLNMSELRREGGHLRPYSPLTYLICVVNVINKLCLITACKMVEIQTKATEQVA